FAHRTTLNPDGSPQASPVWIDHSNGNLLVNTARGRRKDRNRRRDPRVALSIIDPDHPYRPVAVTRRVVKVSEEGADAHIDAMAKKYTGKDKYSLRAPGEVRVLFVIEPSSVAARG